MQNATAATEVAAHIGSDGSATLEVAGRIEEIRTSMIEDARREIISRATLVAATLSTPVTVSVSEPDGVVQLTVGADGSVAVVHSTVNEPIRDQAPPASGSTPAPVAPALPEPRIVDSVPMSRESAPPPPRVVPPTAVVPPAASIRAEEGTQDSPVYLESAAPTLPSPIGEDSPTMPASRRSLREVTFLTSDAAEAPASKGPRSLLRFVGIKPQPSPAELAEREDIRAVSQHWPGPRTIKVANRKGGSNKTPTVAMLAAVFARYGGGGVLAWDNNENQGTLGWRTEASSHGASVLDLLRDEERLMSLRATRGLIDGYVHHQAADKYDVLRSDENDQGDHEITAEEVHRAHAIAERYFRMIIMDSGNTARAANWRAAVEHTDRLVVPTTTMEDRAEAARSMLVTLEDRDAHSAHLSANAVVIISQWKPDDKAEAQRIADLFKELGRTVVTVPFDPALKAGRIRHEALRPATQRAWLAAAAAVARGL